MRFAIGAAGEKDRPPAVIKCLHQISMSGIHYWVLSRGVQVALRQDRVTAVRHEGSPWRTASQHDLGVVRLRAALRAHQVVPLATPIQMWSFNPYRTLRQIDPTIDQDLTRPDELITLEVELLDPNGPMTLVERRALRWSIVQDVSLAVRVEE